MRSQFHAAKRPNELKKNKTSFQDGGSIPGTWELSVGNLHERRKRGVKTLIDGFLEPEYREQHSSHLIRIGQAFP